MTNHEKMTLVDDLVQNIAGELGALAKEGVIPTHESLKFLRQLSDCQVEWMLKNFSTAEVLEFTFQRIRF